MCLPMKIYSISLVGKNYQRRKREKRVYRFVSKCVYGFFPKLFKLHLNIRHKYYDGRQNDRLNFRLPFFFALSFFADLEILRHHFSCVFIFFHWLNFMTFFSTLLLGKLMYLQWVQVVLYVSISITFLSLLDTVAAAAVTETRSEHGLVS